MRSARGRCPDARERCVQEDLDGFQFLAPVAADAIRALPARVAAALVFSPGGGTTRLSAEIRALADREPHAFAAPSTPPVNVREAAPSLAQARALFVAAPFDCTAGFEVSALFWRGTFGLREC